MARAVSAYLESSEERARRAETDAEIARARASAERRARRLTLAAGAITLLALLVVGAATLQAQRVQVRAERQRIARLHQALLLMSSLEGKGRYVLDRARRATGQDAVNCIEALALTGEVVRQSLELETDESTRMRSLSLLEELRAAEAVARAAAMWSERLPRGAGR